MCIRSQAQSWGRSHTPVKVFVSICDVCIGRTYILWSILRLLKFKLCLIYEIVQCCKCILWTITGEKLKGFNFPSVCLFVCCCCCFLFGFFFAQRRNPHVPLLLFGVHGIMKRKSMMNELGFTSKDCHQPVFGLICCKHAKILF